MNKFFFFFFEKKIKRKLRKNNNNNNNNNNNIIENYTFFVSPITNYNEFIINQFLNKYIKDLINNEVGHFYYLKNRIRQIMPKQNNLIHLLISRREALPNDLSKINFIYRYFRKEIH